MTIRNKSIAANGQMKINVGANKKSQNNSSFLQKNFGSANSFLIYTYI